MRLGSVEEVAALGDVGYRNRTRLRSRLARYALADFIDAALDAFAVESLGVFDEKVVAVAQGYCGASEAELCRKKRERFGNEVGDFVAPRRHCADFFEQRQFDFAIRSGFECGGVFPCSRFFHLANIEYFARTFNKFRENRKKTCLNKRADYSGEK